MRRTSLAITSCIKHLRCSTRTVAAQSQRMRSSRFSHSVRIWTRMSFSKSTSKSTKTETVRFHMTSSHLGCSRTSRTEHARQQPCLRVSSTPSTINDKKIIREKWTTHFLWWAVRPILTKKITTFNSTYAEIMRKKLHNSNLIIIAYFDLFGL